MSMSPKKILILSLLRFGDAVQHLSVIDSIAHAYPEAHIHVLENSYVAYFPSHHPAVNKTFILDPNSHADLACGEWHWENLNQNTQELINSLNHEAYDLVISYEHNLYAPTIMRYVNAQTKCGTMFDNDGKLIFLDVWTQFLFLWSDDPRYKNGPQNLVEYKCRVAGVVPFFGASALLESKEEIAKREEFFAAYRLQTPYVCFQIGASEARRQWDVHSFRQVAHAITHQYGHKVVLFGTQDDYAQAEMIASSDEVIVNVCGKTDFALLRSVVENAKLLLTNDTGTMHLAAYLGTPVIELAMAESVLENAPFRARKTTVIQPLLDCFPCYADDRCDNDRTCQRIASSVFVESVVAWVLAGRKQEWLHALPDDVTMVIGDIYRRKEDYSYVKPYVMTEQTCALKWCSYLLPRIWNSIIAGKDNEKKEFLVERFMWRYHCEASQIKRAEEIILSEVVEVQKLITAVLRDLNNCLSAHTQKNKELFQTSLKQIAASDVALAGYDGMLKFFVDHYVLGSKILTRNARGIECIKLLRIFVETIKAMVEEVKKVCKETAVYS